MADDMPPLNPEFDEDAVPGAVPPQTYEELSVNVPEREVDIPDIKSGKSLSEQEDSTDQKSDFQIALQELRPKCPDEKLRVMLESARVSRIYPDNLLDKLYALVMMRMEDDEDENEDVNFIETLMLTQDAMLVGLEGKGIIDVMEMLGATKEAELANLEKGLFN